MNYHLLIFFLGVVLMSWCGSVAALPVDDEPILAAPGSQGSGELPEKMAPSVVGSQGSAESKKNGYKQLRTWLKRMEKGNAEVMPDKLCICMVNKDAYLRPVSFPRPPMQYASQESGEAQPANRMRVYNDMGDWRGQLSYADYKANSQPICLCH